MPAGILASIGLGGLGGAATAGGTSVGLGSLGGSLLGSGGSGALLGSLSGSGGSSALLGSLGGSSQVQNVLTGALQSGVSAIGNAVSGLFSSGNNDHIFANREHVIIGSGRDILAILYNHPLTNGGAIIITEETELADFNINGTNWHDTISAIYVADGVQLTFYEHSNFQGNWDGMIGGSGKTLRYGENRTGTLNSSNLDRDWKYWNDRISSVKVKKLSSYKSPTSSSSTSTTSSSSSTIGNSTSSTSGSLGSSFTGGTLPTVNVSGTKTTTSNNTLLYIVAGVIGFFILKK